MRHRHHRLSCKFGKWCLTILANPFRAARRLDHFPFTIKFLILTRTDTRIVWSGECGIHDSASCFLAEHGENQEPFLDRVDDVFDALVAHFIRRSNRGEQRIGDSRDSAQSRGGKRCICITERMQVRVDFTLGIRNSSKPLTRSTTFAY